MKQFSIYVDDKADRTAIVDNGSNVIALLTKMESARFHGVWDLMQRQRKYGFEEFYEIKMEEMCRLFIPMGLNHSGGSYGRLSC